MDLSMGTSISSADSAIHAYGEPILTRSDCLCTIFALPRPTSSTKSLPDGFANPTRSDKAATSDRKGRLARRWVPQGFRNPSRCRRGRCTSTRFQDGLDLRVEDGVDRVGFEPRIPTNYCQMSFYLATSECNTSDNNPRSRLCF